MKLVELFAGAGCAALGLHRAGFEHVGMVDHDEAATLTLRAAFGDALLGAPHPAVGERHPGVVTWGDVASYDPPRAAVWWASPPCQGFSLAGDRLGPLDPRNGFPALFDCYDRARHKPRWLVVENVAGMLSHKSLDTDEGCHPTCAAAYFARVVTELVHRFPLVDYRVFNCADYGVPQTRRRLIIVAGPRELDWPAPTHAEGGEGGRLPWVSMRTALDLGDELDAVVQTGNRTTSADSDARPLYERDIDRPAPTVRARGEGGMPLSLTYASQSQRPIDPERPAPTLDAGSPRGFRKPWWYRASSADGPSRAIGSKANASILDTSILDRPAPCVSATEEKGAAMSATGVRTSHGGLQRASDALQLGLGRRRATVRECLLLQAMPGDWPLQGTETDRYRCVGNGVPPPLSEAIGRAILRASKRRSR